jgi:hypothetical protein
MKPFGLRFKADNELMIAHRCLTCGKISNNRIAGDDYTDAILNLVPNYSDENILTIADINEVYIALFGKFIGD